MRFHLILAACVADLSGGGLQFFHNADPGCWNFRGTWYRTDATDARGFVWPITLPYFGARVALGYRNGCPSELERQ